ncbi:hypothetical protein FOZ62_013261 [Perkinsus olseni]|uniref:Uncharacterized protein n=1 Tax=Perkinsus olseni TaxID=32597 RepID=A0A7J6QEP2_PEROL|nr:hypothetical protein FOZ62_013261 [Perkinsus olseni]
MTCLVKVLLLYFVEHAFSCGYNQRIWAIFPGSDQEMPAIITSVFTDTFEVVWEESRWYCRIEGNDKSACTVRKEDARDELGPCKTISGGPSLDDEGSSSDEAVRSSPDGNSELPTAVLISILGGGLVLFFGAVYFCMRSSSKMSDSPTNRTMGRPVAEAPIDIDELGSKITKPSAVRSSGKAAEEPLSVRTTPRLPLPGEGPAVVVRVGVGIWVTQSSGSSALGNTAEFAPESSKVVGDFCSIIASWVFGLQRSLASSFSCTSSSHRPILELTKGVLAILESCFPTELPRLRLHAVHALSSIGQCAVGNDDVEFRKALVRVLIIVLAIPSVLGCRYNERVRAVFQRTGQEMSAIVLNVYQDTLEVVWEEARWYCNIQGNDKSHCIVKKTEARNTQGEYCRQPSVGSGTDGDGDFDGGGAELDPSGDGGFSTVIVVVIIAASVLVFCGCIYLCIRRSAESLDLSSPKNGAAYKLGRGFTETISRMLKENDEVSQHVHYRRGGVLFLPLLRGGVKPVVKDAENPDLPEVTPRISITPSHLDVRASTAKGESRPKDASRKSSAAISDEEMQRIRDAAAALAGAQTLATDESSNVSYRSGGASVSAADVLILAAFTTVVADCRPIWWGIQKGLGGTP